MTRLARLVLGVIGLAIGVVGVLALREATLSTHASVSPDSQIELVVSARTKNGEPGQSLDEMVEAQVTACRLEVASDVVGDIEAQGDGRYRALLSPSMDQTNRRQFRGCLEDWLVDHVLIDVIRLEETS